MNEPSTARNESVLDELKGRLRGELIRPDDPEYEEARKVYNAMIDRRPALIVRAANVADVMSAVRFARENHLRVAVRGGGHSVPGFGTWWAGDRPRPDAGNPRGPRAPRSERKAAAPGTT